MLWIAAILIFTGALVAWARLYGAGAILAGLGVFAMGLVYVFR